jgi:hypothetical protein
MSSAKENVAAFQTWHSSRTYNPGHPEIDPWMRDVLLSLQSTLNQLAEQMDSNTERLDRIERFLRSK